MILFLVLGFALIALALLVGTAQVFAADRERGEALRRLRPRDVRKQRQSVVLGDLKSALARLYLRMTRSRSLSAVQGRLEQAAYAHRISAEAFVALQVVFVALGALFGIASGNGAQRFLLALVFGALGGYLPHFALSRAAANRTRQIERELPHFVDQLAIAVEAGMSFDAALSYLLRATTGPLAEELGRTANEVRVGETRRGALKMLRERIGSEDVKLFVNALLSSDQLGTPLGQILRAQASDIRHRHQMRAEEQAQKAPVKMLFPIVIFILPVMFIVILGPALISIDKYL